MRTVACGKELGLRSGVGVLRSGVGVLRSGVKVLKSGSSLKVRDWNLILVSNEAAACSKELGCLNFRRALNVSSFKSIYMLRTHL